MTKKEESKALKWRLAKLPTGADIAKLVEQQVLTKEEAREILLNNVELSQGDVIERLEEEIKFLRSTIDTLAARTVGGWGMVYHFYQNYKPISIGNTPVWSNYGNTLGVASKTMGNGSSTGSLPVMSSIPATTSFKG